MEVGTALERSTKREAVTKPREDYLDAFLGRFPVPQALMRACEARRLSELEFPFPVLDLGCGNGVFARVLFGAQTVAVGLDISPLVMPKARGSGAYQHVVMASAASMPFRDAYFGAVLSNSVLEHIPPLDETLCEVSRVLRPQGRFVFTIPHDRTPENHLYPSVLNRFGLRGLSEGYNRLWRKVFKEYHFYSPQQWRGRLAAAGLQLDDFFYAHPAPMARVYDLLLPVGLVSSLKRKTFGENAFSQAIWMKPFWKMALADYYSMDGEAGSLLVLVGQKPASEREG